MSPARLSGGPARQDVSGAVVCLMEKVDFGRVTRAPLTPVAFLRRAADVFGDRTAVVEGKRRLSYAELGGRVSRLASALHRAGIAPGDRVAYLAPNSLPVLEGHFGVPLAGAAIVTINIRLAPSEVAYILDHSGARLLVADSELAGPVAPLLAERPKLQVVIAGEGPPPPQLAGAMPYEQFLAQGALGLLAEDPPVGEDGLIAINYTSGTTGFPKGVMYTHRGACLNALGEALETKLDQESVYLWTLPMFHCNGWCFTWGVTAVGGTHVCLRKVDPAQVFALVESERVTHFCAAPTVLIDLAQHARTHGVRLSHPVTICTGGAPPAPAVIEAIEGIGARLIHFYGLTETYGPHTLCVWRGKWNPLPREQKMAIKARQGVASTVAGELRVVDEEMRDVPRDGKTVGEVVMRGHNVMAGYFNDPEATAAAFRGGWFHSGDLAVMHPDGYIEIRDRAKDIIISGGENIATVEVERTLYQHPAVLEVAVVGVPHPRWGEVPKAFVTLRPGAEATAEELIGFCRERLAHFKCPKEIAFGELPKTSTGKIQKYVLRQREKEATGKS